MLRVVNLILLVSLIPIIVISLRLGLRLVKKDPDFFQRAIQKKKENLNVLSEKLNETKAEKKYLENKLADLSKLYGITKEMSFMLRFKDLFRSLGVFLEENFKFEKFKIIFLKYKDGKRLFENVYQLSSDSQDIVELDNVLRGVAEQTAISRIPVFLKKSEDLFNFGFNEETQNVLVIPLLARRRAISVIIVENTDESQLDKFYILASQFAFQIERISLFDNVEKLSITDGLTKTFLRRHFSERFEEELVRAAAAGAKLSIVMIDLDHFKRCNDAYGHLVGDVVLREFVEVLRRNIREIDIVSRFGGEEFCVLLPETDKKSAFAVAERIRKAVEEHEIHAYDEIVKITVSIGVSSFPDDAKSQEALIELADKALYESKEKGRNRASQA